MNSCIWPTSMKEAVFGAVSDRYNLKSSADSTSLVSFPMMKADSQHYSDLKILSLATDASDNLCGSLCSPDMLLQIFLQTVGSIGMQPQHDSSKRQMSQLLFFGEYTVQRNNMGDDKTTDTVLTIRSLIAATQYLVSSNPEKAHIPNAMQFPVFGDLITQMPLIADYPSKRRLSPEILAAQVLYNVKVHKPCWIELFLKKLPKCDLHNHLAPDPEDNLQYAKSKNLSFDRNKKIFTHNTDENAIPAALLGLQCYAEVLDEYYESVKVCSHRHWTTQQTSKFFKTFSTTCSTNMPLERQLLVEIKKAIQQNLSYLELMVDLKSPEQPDLAGFDMANLKDSLAKIMPWCQEYAKHWVRELDNIGDRLTKDLGWKNSFFNVENPVYVAFLVEVMRTPSINSIDPSGMLATFFADAAAGMILAKMAPDKVVGINIAGPEHNPIARECFLQQMEILDFLYEALGQPNIALHAGELTREISSSEDMLQRIQISIDKGHAKRIGHGTCLQQADNPLSLIEKMREKNVSVEICFASSKLIHGVEPSIHPFSLYYQQKVPLVLGSDDPNILNTDLTQEFMTAFMNYDCTYLDLKQWVRNSLEHSFLPGESIFTLRNDAYVYRPEFSGLEFDGKIAEDGLQFLDNSLKAKMQVKLEKQLAKFESDLLPFWHRLAGDADSSQIIDPLQYRIQEVKS